MFWHFILSSVGFGEDTSSKQLLYVCVYFFYGILFRRAGRRTLRIVDNDLTILECLPGLWFMWLELTWLVDLRSGCFFWGQTVGYLLLLPFPVCWEVIWLLGSVFHLLGSLNMELRHWWHPARFHFVVFDLVSWWLKYISPTEALGSAL